MYNNIEEIKELWKYTNANLISQLDYNTLKGATYGEILGLVGTFLNSVKEENKDAYHIAKLPIDRILIEWGNYPAGW